MLFVHATTVPSLKKSHDENVINNKSCQTRGQEEDKKQEEEEENRKTKTKNRRKKKKKKKNTKVPNLVSYTNRKRKDDGDS